MYHVGPCAGEDREALCPQTKQHEGLTGCGWSALVCPWKTQDRSMEAILNPIGRPWTNVRHGAQDERFS